MSFKNILYIKSVISELKLVNDAKKPIMPVALIPKVRLMILGINTKIAPYAKVNSHTHIAKQSALLFTKHHVKLKKI